MNTGGKNITSLADHPNAPGLAVSIEQLPLHHRAILFQLAMLGSVPKSVLLANMDRLKSSSDSHRHIKTSEYDKALNSLLQQGWLSKGYGHWNLTPDHINAVYFWLLAHPELWPDAQKLRLRDWYQPSLVVVWLAILAGEAALLAPALEAWMSEPHYAPSLHPVSGLLADETGKQVFSLLNEDVQIQLLATCLNDASYHLNDATHVWHFACDYYDASLSAVLRGPLALQALWRDDQTRLNQLVASDNLPFTLVGWMALSRGDRQGAMDAFQNLVVQYRKQTRKRKLQLPALPAMMAALTLLMSEEPAYVTTLNDLINYANSEKFGEGWNQLEWMLRQFGSVSAGNKPKDRIEPLSGMSGVLEALVLFWRNDVTDRSLLYERLTAFRAQLTASGYPLLAWQISTILHSQFNDPAPESAADRIPLCQLWQRKPDWEYALEALGQLAPKNPETTSRLAWMISKQFDYLELVPLEQKRNKQGWSKGRSIALKRLHYEDDKFPWLLAQDRQALRHVHYHRNYYGSDNYAIDVEAALPALAGHPAVFWADAPDIRIDIELGQISLVLTEEHNQLLLKLLPPISGDQTLVVEKETTTRLVVYSVSDEHRRIADIVGQGLHLPLEARQKVLQSVASIAPLLPVRTDLTELMAHIPHVPADNTIYAHLLPLGEGLRMQLRVRPLSNGAWFPPGRGSPIINSDQGGQTVQAKRDLKDERQKMQQVLRACPLLMETEQDNTEWQFSDTQDALELLTQLRNVNELICVWPEGERLRLNGRRDTQALTLNVRRKGEWFALSGELHLNDGRVLQLRQLLTLMQEGRGRFIHLGEQEWMALDNRLRQRLQQLTLLDGAGEGDEINLNGLTLPFLQTLAEEVGHLTADDAWHQQLARLEAREEHYPKVPSTLKAELRDYQQEGFCWLSRLGQWGVGACLADDMGLGKTLQALALLLERAPGGPQLVVAPTSVTHNWLSESRRFAPTLKIRDYRDQREISGAGEFDVIVVSYGLLLQDAEVFNQHRWHSLVLDEAQAIKNAQTQRARAVMALQSDFRLALSGTPVENHLGELWSLFRFLNPGLLGGLKSFNQRFATPIEQGDKLTASTLKQLIKPFMLRRTKAQVLDELPPRTDVLHQIPMSENERHWYEALRQQALERMEQKVDDINPIQVLAEITRLRRFCCHPSLVLNDITLESSKLSACLELISELRENHHKALVFSQFVDHLALLRAALDQQGVRYQYLDGSTPATERKKRVDAFQSGEGELFLISLKAGGTGLNLTAADYVIHLDPWWNPAVEDQASDRAHRLGQERPVTVYRLVMEDTIEEQMVALHRQKRQLAEDLLEGSDSVGRLDTEALLAVLRG